MASGAGRENLAVDACAIARVVGTDALTRLIRELLQLPGEHEPVTRQLARGRHREHVEAGKPRLVQRTDHALPHPIRGPQVTRHSCTDRGLVGRRRRWLEFDRDARIAVTSRACLGEPRLAATSFLDRRGVCHERGTLANECRAPPADRDALVDVIRRIAALVELVSELVELDLNPVLVMAPCGGAIAVDARMRLR